MVRLISAMTALIPIINRSWCVFYVKNQIKGIIKLEL